MLHCYIEYHISAEIATGIFTKPGVKPGVANAFPLSRKSNNVTFTSIKQPIAKFLQRWTVLSDINLYLDVLPLFFPQITPGSLAERSRHPTVDGKLEVEPTPPLC